MKKFSIWAVAALSVCLFALSCGKDDDPDTPDTPDTPKTGDENPTITSFTPLSGTVGTLVTINGTNFDATKSNNTVKFGNVVASLSTASATKLVAEVPEGAETAKISVTVSGKTATSTDTFKVTEDVPLTIALNEEAVTLYPYPKYTAMLEVTTDIGENTVAWSSSDETVATVDADGTVTALKIGEATITANAGGAEATCTVSVVDGPVTKLELDKEGMELYTGDTGELSIFALEADVEETSTPVWSSDNTDVATVDQDGNVTAVAEGEAVITVTVDNASATSTIVVNPNVYISGNEMNEQFLYVAKVWKNGEVLYELTDGTKDAYAGDIFVDGDDIYVVGNEYDGNIQVAKIWKNGVATTLAGFANARSIFVSESIVYVAGTIKTDNGTKAAVWKNGMLELLPTETTNGVEVNSIFVHEGVVYVVGSDFTNFTSVAALWEDGEVTFLSETQSEAQSVFVSDENIYVAGFIGGEPNISATIWANGTEISGAAPSSAEDVYIENGDVYTALSVNYEPQIWKNGALLYDLPGPVGIESSIEGLTLHNSKVYSVGEVYDENDKLNIIYWVNDELFHLTDAEFNAYGPSIFVK
ncbi:hypothetical protein GUA46_01290 [Muricauda sp. HICW]|uniref:Uncharacterized protein n=1 Tax=Flagellimonas chongwuensis TaxID=2697365 RepID=A0A850NAL2_9FLAO|nr:Ig-like domain-containing protein [Allomuricauda chongwuensis]NVN16959.1 hypothetical protein [Allomuricauda chongwuensis]